MSIISCPKCDAQAQRGSFKAWQFIVAICFFPIGLLAFLAGRSPNICHKCGHIWQ